MTDQSWTAGIEIGDRVTFRVAEREVEGVVAEVRPDELLVSRVVVRVIRRTQAAALGWGKPRTVRSRVTAERFVGWVGK